MRFQCDGHFPQAVARACNQTQRSLRPFRNHPYSTRPYIAHPSPSLQLNQANFLFLEHMLEEPVRIQSLDLWATRHEISDALFSPSIHRGALIICEDVKVSMVPGTSETRPMACTQSLR